jgi:hypothetical protein
MNSIDEAQAACYRRREASRIIDMILASDNKTRIDIMEKLMNNMHQLVTEKSRLEHKMIDGFK